jgi:hypothetical protein
MYTWRCECTGSQFVGRGWGSAHTRLWQRRVPGAMPHTFYASFHGILAMPHTFYASFHGILAMPHTFYASFRGILAMPHTFYASLNGLSSGCRRSLGVRMYVSMSAMYDDICVCNCYVWWYVSMQVWAARAPWLFMNLSHAHIYHIHMPMHMHIHGCVHTYDTHTHTHTHTLHTDT